MKKQIPENKVAIITGAGKGIGKAVSIELWKQGYFIILVSRTRSDLEKLKKFLIRADYFVCDVRYVSQVKKVVNAVAKKYGRIDVLVNNAGLWYHKKIEDTSESEYDEMVDTNLKGAFLFSKFVIPVMKKQKSGIIINVSSGAGKYGFPGLSIYSATKFGIIGMTQSLARECFQDGIKVFAVCPSGVDTEGYRKKHPSADEEFFKRLLKPEKVAKEVANLIKKPKKTGESVDVY